MAPRGDGGGSRATYIMGTLPPGSGGGDGGGGGGYRPNFQRNLFILAIRNKN